MEQTATTENGEGPATPEPPIILLGKHEPFLAFADSIPDVLRIVNVKDPGAEPVPPPDDIDYFDVHGRALEPIVIGGQLLGLAVRDSQEEIRYRIGRLYHYLSISTPRGEGPAGERPFSNDRSFEENIRELAEAEVKGCPWIKHVFGLC